MNSLCRRASHGVGVAVALLLVQTSSPAAEVTDAGKCEALLDMPTLTITQARLREAGEGGPTYCYVKGTISPQITYHVQLPLPANWNSRFLNWGDGGKDGDLDFADERLAQGYAVANSNIGHDNGTEPGASFGYNNRQAEIDFGYRAVHLTVNAAKALVTDYYGRAAQYAYHEGCSTGGRQALMEAQRYPWDFDGIVAGAPVAFYQENAATIMWASQKLFADHFAGNLAFDNDGDGIQESLGKLQTLAAAVVARCDTLDGIKDGVIDDPLQCPFEPAVDLKPHMCRNDVNADNCFTTRQVANITAIYRGPHDHNGRLLHKGMPFGSELAWLFVPHAGNHMQPFRQSADHLNYLFYEKDPGVAVPDLSDLSYQPRKDGPMPEWAWWEFDIEDLGAGKGDFMRAITNATDPDMRRFLLKNDGKLILYHGWADTNAAPEPILDYYKDVVKTSFDDDVEQARAHARLFMVPGMHHCRGGPGPNEWDRLAPMIDWVEHGVAPDHLVARHTTEGKVDNERLVCAYPQRAHYVGPAAGRNNPANWVAGNFVCR